MKCFMIAASFVMFFSNVNAQENRDTSKLLQQIVVTATRQKAKVSSLPFAVSVWTKNRLTNRFRELFRKH